MKKKGWVVIGVAILLGGYIFCNIKTEISMEIKSINDELIDNVRANNFDRVKDCLKNGANINYIDKFKSTPLFYAITTNNFIVVNYLIKNGANINFVYGKNKANFLHIAVQYHVRFYNSIDIIELLIKSGINIDFQDKYGNTSLHEACSTYVINKDVIIFLIKNGANMDIKNNYGVSPYSMSVENDMLPLKSLLDSLK